MAPRIEEVQCREPSAAGGDTASSGRDQNSSTATKSTRGRLTIESGHSRSSLRREDHVAIKATALSMEEAASIPLVGLAGADRTSTSETLTERRFSKTRDPDGLGKSLANHRDQPYSVYLAFLSSAARHRATFGPAFQPSPSPSHTRRVIPPTTRCGVAPRKCSQVPKP